MGAKDIVLNGDTCNGPQICAILDTAQKLKTTNKMSSILSTQTKN